MNWNLYIVQCKDDSLYTGITMDIKRRIRQHNSKNGAKSIKGKLPVKLVYSEICPDRISALKREHQIKKWERKRKLQLIGNAL